VPTVDDVLGEFTPTELAAFTQLLGGQPLDNTTKLAVIVGNVVAEVRGSIIAGGYDVDTSPNTIPAGLLNDLIAIARWRFLVSAPNFKAFQTEERKGLYTDSLAKLSLIAQQQYSPESPSPSEIVRTGMWNSENKLIMRTHPIPQPGTQYGPQDGTQYANPDAPVDIGAPPP
jgi:hypothetical protein